MTSITTLLCGAVRCLWSYLAPLWDRVEPLQVIADLCLRSRRELVVENATLRHQVSVLRRSSGHLRLGPSDRLRLLIGAALLPAWRKAIVVVQPETILKWHRTGFRLFWRHRSKSRNAPRLAPDKIDLIRDMAKRNRLWGAREFVANCSNLASGSANAPSRNTSRTCDQGVEDKVGQPSWRTTRMPRGLRFHPGV